METKYRQVTWYVEKSLGVSFHSFNCECRGAALHDVVQRCSSLETLLTRSWRRYYLLFFLRARIRLCDTTLG